VDQSLTKIVEQALAQLPEILELDAPRAEAWAGDMISLAAEVCGSSSAASVELTTRFSSIAGTGAAVVISAIAALGPDAGCDSLEDAASGGDPPEGLPEWFEALGTSVCDGAWIFSNRRGESAVFRFTDSLDAGHVVAVDLIPGHPESVGEVIVGPPEMAVLADDPESHVAAAEADPKELAGRVSRAVGSTVGPSDSLLITGPLLAARIAGITGSRPDMLLAFEPAEVPDLPAVDPEADAWATDILVRALGIVRSDSAGAPPDQHRDASATAADLLRRAADSDAAMAQWLAASRGPVDLDDPDHVVTMAALSATVCPHAMLPLDRQAREAVVDLEWADWLGAVIGLTREGPGASTEPAHLVDLINRCPEVTSTIPKSDRPRVEWALATCTELWDELGVARSAKLTEFGAWALPLALIEAWRPEA